MTTARARAPCFTIATSASCLLSLVAATTACAPCLATLWSNGNALTVIVSPRAGLNAAAADTNPWIWAIGMLPGPRGSGQPVAGGGLALKIEDGDGFDRAGHAATVEALRQAGVVDGQALRSLARYHRPVSTDPRGKVAAESIASFELAPIGELIG